MVTDQKVIFTITDCLDGTTNMHIEFEPALAGENSETYKNMLDTEKHLQQVGGMVASNVFNALKKYKSVEVVEEDQDDE